MKNKKLLIILLIVVLLVVYYLFGMDYLKQRRQQTALTPQISDVVQALALMPEPPQDLEQRLASAQADLTAEQSALLSEINSTQAINTILKLADRCQVKAIPLITEPWSAVKVGGHDYYVFKLNVSFEGSFSDLVSFTDKLENEEIAVSEELSLKDEMEKEESVTRKKTCPNCGNTNKSQIREFDDKTKII